MLTAIEYIDEDLQGHTQESFAADRRTRQVVERNLENLSESSRWLLTEQTASEPDIEWIPISRFGDIFRHGYWTTSATRLWNESILKMPSIKAALQRIVGRALANTEDNDSGGSPNAP